MLCFNELHSQIAHLEISSQDLEFISKLIGDPSFKHNFGNCFCYFGSCPHNTFYSFLSWNQQMQPFRFFFLQVCTLQLWLWFWVLEDPLLWQYLFQQYAMCSQFFIYIRTKIFSELLFLTQPLFFQLHCSYTWTRVLNL